MAALMLFLRGVGMLVGGALIWIVFALVPPWLCGFSLCRHNAWWTPADKVRAYVTIKNERLARSAHTRVHRLEQPRAHRHTHPLQPLHDEQVPRAPSARWAF